MRGLEGICSEPRRAFESLPNKSQKVVPEGGLSAAFFCGRNFAAVVAAAAATAAAAAAAATTAAATAAAELAW